MIHVPGTLIPIVALMIPMVVVPNAVWARYRGKVRQMEHLERIKAMEMGLSPRPSGLNWPTAFLCAAIGGGVPVGSMLLTWLAMLTIDGTPVEIWAIPAVVAFPAIAAAKKIADRTLEAGQNANQPAYQNSSYAYHPSQTQGKPDLDPDALDVVGRRG